MKLLRVEERRSVYRLSAAEQQILLLVLGHYPVMRQTGGTLSRTTDGDNIDDAQRLLDEALKDQREQHRVELHRWLRDDGVFTRTDDGVDFSLPHDKREWLLQILNDVRVGCWQAMGSPDEAEPDPLGVEDEEKRSRLWLMELAGMFQSVLLDADDD